MSDSPVVPLPSPSSPPTTPPLSSSVPPVSAPPPCMNSPPEQINPRVLLKRAWVAERKALVAKNKAACRAAKAQAQLDPLVDKKVIQKWDHYMHEHTPGNRNPFGCFEKDGCVLDIWMGTNCGIYWMCARSSCRCASCQSGNPVQACECVDCTWVHALKLTESENSPEKYLRVLYILGFQFQGWGPSDPFLASSCSHSHFRQEPRIVSIAFS